MPDRSLAEWLQTLEARHPVEIDLGLERISAVAERLALPPIADKVIVVAGTNGKGSCVRALESAALMCGLRVATYTSPHLVRYNERVTLRGNPVGDASFCEAFEAIEVARSETSLTYFEVGTLAALWIMAREKLDLAVLEVGLGGRFDAVNIVDSDVAIITSIDIDHINWLGDNRGAIALEKAGVARAGKPLICAEADPPEEMVDYLARLGAKVLYRGRDFDATFEEQGSGRGVFITANGAKLEVTELDSPAVPAPSVAAAVQALLTLDIPFARGNIQRLFAEVALPGRYQKMAVNGRTLIFDVAHNPAAGDFLANKLRRESSPVNAVVAIMADKDVAGFVAALAKSVDHWHLGDLKGVGRALPAEQLGELLGTCQCSHSVSASLGDAFELALAQTPEHGTIVVCGSFLTVGAIMTHLGEHYGL